MAHTRGRHACAVRLAGWLAGWHPRLPGFRQRLLHPPARPGGGEGKKAPPCPWAGRPAAGRVPCLLRAVTPARPSGRVPFRPPPHTMASGTDPPLLSHANTDESSYGNLTISEISPKKLCRSVTDGSAEPLGWEWTIPT